MNNPTSCTVESCGLLSITVVRVDLKDPYPVINSVYTTQSVGYDFRILLLYN